MSFIQSMSISRESMMNNQLALTVVAHNIANVNTDGYAKQRVNFAENRTPYSTNSIATAIYSMNGASISDIVSYANQTINTSVRNANTKNEFYNHLNAMLSNMNELTNDLGDEGLQKVISDFFTAAQNLSKTPTDSSTRLAYVQSAKNVAARLNSLYTTAETQKADIAGNGLNVANSKIEVTLLEANMSLKKIADINAQILLVGADSGSANSLIDERNRILDSLSGVIPVRVIENSNGTASVLLDNVKLVSGGVLEQTLTCAPTGNPDDPIKIQVLNSKSGQISVENLNSIIGERGAIGAMLKMVTTSDGFISLNTIMENLDILANSISAAVNAIQTYDGGDMKACYLSRDANGETILAYDPPPPDIFEGTGAKNIKVTDAIIRNNNLVTTARANTNDVTNPNWQLNVGNGDNILLAAELRNKNVVDSTGLGNPHDTTIENYLSSLTLRIGVQGEDIASKLDTATIALASFANERLGIIGVNMDEELADMIKYQRSYEASARMFSTVNEVLQVLINLGR